MTPRRMVGAAAAILLSGGAHIAGSGWIAPETVELDGGGEPAPARLGTSFADMVAGMPGTARPELTEPVEVVTDAARPAEAEAQEAETPDTAERAEVMEASNSAEREVAEASVNAVPPEPASPDTTARVEPMPDSPVASATSSAVAATPASPAAAEPLRAAAASATPRAETSRPEAARAVPETEAELLTPLTSPRPAARPENLAPPPAPQRPQVARPRPQPQPPAATGNGASNTTRGSATGTEAGTATATAPAPQQPTAQPGNAAAVANYPGQVMRRISRQGRPRLRHTGPDAVVAFRIASNGGLAGASIARSSGNAELDRAALSIVRRAAPFPPPPGGAQTSFSVAFGGR
ncbi:energy transducer TonB family protein [Gymnodinialimonas ceratoperidinii]|uniref:Energy transducer TonB n=1 Tax=Gymnodinialimonas ceratoperidinii TaxID=2856823 RepID=A0A8F6Y9W0_9RHOB|nr:energy transducer TonB [Gymnodinialimonas ceratoperidinii]QXT38948.1 energy transducer TonB [Gymnodinialimonas ceratoperidinii]